MHHPTSEFDYELPESSIAQTAIEPRDSSRLLISSTLEDRVFRDLPAILSPGDLLVVNRTRVRRARLETVRRDTGGRVEVLLLHPRGDDRWQIMVRPARRLRRGVVLDTALGDRDHALSISLETDPDAGVAEASVRGGDVEMIVSRVGEIPLPPYFHGTLEDDERYQTVFADQPGSAAAPTAALHFTERLVDELGDRGVPITAVELDVGLDTFRPIAADDLADHEIHSERYFVPDGAAAAIEATREAGGRIVAVGTTVVRTLESAAEGSIVAPGPGTADIFIMPGYRLAVVDAVLTNFHAPRTTLVALVAALLGSRWHDVYSSAIDRGYRFLSFGDAMFIDEVAPAARRMG